MTLRARLTLFFTGIVVVPLLAATVALQTLAGQEVRRRSDTRLDVASRAVAALWEERLGIAERQVRGAAEAVAPQLSSAELGGLVEGLRASAGLDFLVVVARNGQVLGAAVESAEFLDGSAPPSPADLASEDPVPGLLRARAEVASDRRQGTVAGGWFTDADFLRDLEAATGAGVALVSGDRVLASTVSPPPAVSQDGLGTVSVGDGRRALIATIRGQQGQLVLVVPEEGIGIFHAPVWAVVGLGLFLAILLGYVLAGVISRPVQRLTEGARAVAAGQFDTRIEVDGAGDVVGLAEAFNAMTENLRRYVGELQDSRDELRRGLERLGTTLRSTHDLEGMLGVVLETAAVTLGARSGAVYLTDPAGRELRLEVARGFEPSPFSAIPVGRGVAGRAALGAPVLVPSPDEAVPETAEVEPATTTALAVPLVRAERTIGVLALYDRTVPEPFAPDDVATLASFAGQASVAIENVLLHQEAQRLSLTDGLTGVWNRRYLQLVMGKEIDRAQRFGRSVALLLVDIDHFKKVNDEFGHLCGDEVLVEVTRRLLASIRSQIDTVGRYGGEEFIVLLPETPLEGARVVAEKVRTSIGGRPFTCETGAGEISVTVSIGIASFPEDGRTVDDLVHAADLALYRAKQGGRDRVEAAG